MGKIKAGLPTEHSCALVLIGKLIGLIKNDFVNLYVEQKRSLAQITLIRLGLTRSKRTNKRILSGKQSSEAPSRRPVPRMKSRFFYLRKVAVEIRKVLHAHSYERKA